MALIAASLFAVSCSSGSRPSSKVDAGADTESSDMSSVTTPLDLVDTDTCTSGPQQALVVAWARCPGDQGVDGDGAAVLALPGGGVVFGGEVVGLSLGNYYLFAVDADGELLWTSRWQSEPPGNPEAYVHADDLALAENGDILVTGWFGRDVLLDHGGVNPTVLKCKGDKDILVARYTADGTLLWVATAGGGNHDYGHAITAGPGDIALVAGRYDTEALFGEGGPMETTLEGFHDSPILARYEQDGTLGWVRQDVRTGNGNARVVVSLPDGSIRTAGYYSGGGGDWATFGEGGPNETQLLEQGHRDIFIAGFTEHGLLEWARRAGGVSGNVMDIARGGARVDESSFVVTGDFGATAVFGEGEPGQEVLFCHGDADGWLARYGKDGSLAWARGFGGLWYDNGWEVAVADEAITLAGRVDVTGVFGECEPNQTTIPAELGLGTVVIARYSLDGQLEWAYGFGGSGSTSVRSVDLTPDGGIVVTGSYAAGEVVFGDDEDGNPVSCFEASTAGRPYLVKFRL